MRKLAIYRNNTFVGVLTETVDKSYIFRYDDLYFSDTKQPAISLTLTKNQQTYNSKTLFPFFFNMLSEGVNKKLQSRQLKIDENDHRSVRKGKWIRESLKKVEQLKPIAKRYDLTITELAIKFILTKKAVSSVLPTVVSTEEIENFASMSDGNYIGSADMKEIDELYNQWSPYDLKATTPVSPPSNASTT